MTRRRPFQPLTTTRYDAIVIGTALPQALLAAALAHSGAAVLHLDPLSFYGSCNATLTAAQLTEAISDIQVQTNSSLDSSNTNSDPSFDLTTLPEPSLGKILFPLGARVLKNGSVRASIDLVPRPIMAAGSMVDILVRCDVGHYLDFRQLEALFVQFGSGLRRVPASRSDVFQSRAINMLEKRLLMRFVKRCQELADGVAPEGTFGDFMDKMSLTPALRTFLTQSISFCSPQVSAREGVNSVYNYQKSLMRFGTKTPFLYPNYGTGELSQAFCRLCAVNGGTYVLRRGASAVIRGGGDDQFPVGVMTTENEVIRASHVFLPEDLHCPRSSDVPAVWRIAAVLDGSITKNDEPKRVLVTVPAGVSGNNVDVRIRQLDDSVMVCESGRCVLYVETVGPGRENDVMAVVRRYVRLDEEEVALSGVGEQANDEQQSEEEDGEVADGENCDCQSVEKPLLLWGISYARPIPSESDSELNGIVPIRSIEEGIDADELIKEAERCFRIARSGFEFLPACRRDTVQSDVTEHVPNGHGAETENVEAVGD